jgi:Co/Zn/Cd efflux system component
MKKRLKAERTGAPVFPERLETTPRDRVVGLGETPAGLHAHDVGCSHVDARELASASDATRARRNLRVLGWVLAINMVTMVAEIVTGKVTGSVALSADGWHMAGHTVALGLTYFVMRTLVRLRTEASGVPLADALARDPVLGRGARLARLERNAGLANAGLLVIVGAYTVYDGIASFLHPEVENPVIALSVASWGLLVNVAGGALLHGSHDRNSVAERGMYLHIVSDALMSCLAILALCVGAFTAFPYADPVVGVLGGLVILRWGAALLAQGARR